MLKKKIIRTKGISWEVIEARNYVATNLAQVHLSGWQEKEEGGIVLEELIPFEDQIAESVIPDKAKKIAEVKAYVEGLAYRALQYQKITPQTLATWKNFVTGNRGKPTKIILPDDKENEWGALIFVVDEGNRTVKHIAISPYHGAPPLDKNSVLYLLPYPEWQHYASEAARKVRGEKILYQVRVYKPSERRAKNATNLFTLFKTYKFTDIMIKPDRSEAGSLYNAYVRYGREYQKVHGWTMSSTQAEQLLREIRGLATSSEGATTKLKREPALFTYNLPMPDGLPMTLRISMTPAGRTNDQGEKEVVAAFIRRVSGGTVQAVGENFFVDPKTEKRDPEKAREIRGLLPQQVKALEWVLRHPGMFLFTGFTNSGKSTVMRAILRWIIEAGIAGPYPNIISVEDPLEELVPGVVQISLVADPAKKKEEYRKILRMILTADSDILSLAETRDPQDIQNVLNVASRGAIVFTTMHVGKSRNPYIAVKNLISAFLTSEAQKKQLEETLVGNTWQVLVTAWNDPATGEGLRKKLLKEGKVIRVKIRDFLQEIVADPNGAHLRFLIEPEKWHEELAKQGFSLWNPDDKLRQKAIREYNKLLDSYMEVALEDYISKDLELLAEIWTKHGTAMPVEEVAFRKLAVPSPEPKADNGTRIEASQVFSSAAFGIPKSTIRRIAMQVWERNRKAYATAGVQS